MGIGEWHNFLKKIVDLNANTLMVYINGHYLPYQSKAFPELVQHDHPNVKNEFFSEVIKLAKNYGIRIILVFTTTGHAGKFLETNSELKTKTNQISINLEEYLLPFPRHIRKRKSQFNKGNAQVGFGILCHNHPIAQQFVSKLIQEGLDLYPDVDGIALHPPESIFPCYCEFCCHVAKTAYTENLLQLSEQKVRNFYLSSYLDFQNTIIENDLLKLKKSLYLFTVPWLFEPEFEKIVGKIHKNMALIEWDYNLELPRIEQLKERLLRYQKYGHAVWFMPTAGFGINSEEDLETQYDRIQQQIKIAINANVDGVIHFVGPNCSHDFTKTNYYYNS